MAKVEITATPKVNNKLLDDRDLLSRVLKTLGKNDQLLREARKLLDEGFIDHFARYTSALNSADDYSAVVTLSNSDDDDDNDVVVTLINANGDIVDSVVFDKEEFYSCLMPRSATSED